jgi:prophage antirepressor-like protein
MNNENNYPGLVPLDEPTYITELDPAMWPKPVIMGTLLKRVNQNAQRLICGWTGRKFAPRNFRKYQTDGGVDEPYKSGKRAVYGYRQYLQGLVILKLRWEKMSPKQINEFLKGKDNEELERILRTDCAISPAELGPVRQRAILGCEKITESVPTPAPAAAGPPKTISSLKIAELTGRKHGNLRRSLFLAMTKAGLVPRQFDGVYKDSRSRRKPCYYLTRDVYTRVRDVFLLQELAAIGAWWRQQETDSTVATGQRSEDLARGILAGVPVKESVGVTVGNPDGVAKVNFDVKEDGAVPPSIVPLDPEDVDLTTWGTEAEPPPVDPEDIDLTAYAIEAWNAMERVGMTVVKPGAATQEAPASPATHPAIAIFDSPEFGAIRTVTEGEKPLFCAKDVALALDYAYPANAIQDHCKGVVVLSTPSPGGVQSMKFIPESDVYRLVMRSRLPGAERFQDWVVEEVLPAIRQTGRFEVAPATLPTYPEALRALADAVEQNEAQARLLEVKDAQLAEAAPKVEAYDRFLNDEGFSSIRETSLKLQIPEKKFVSACIDIGILQRGSDNKLMPRAPWNSEEFGYMRYVRAHDGFGNERFQTMFTPEGIVWAGKKVGDSWKNQ